MENSPYQDPKSAYLREWQIDAERIVKSGTLEINKPQNEVAINSSVHAVADQAKLNVIEKICLWVLDRSVSRFGMSVSSSFSGQSVEIRHDSFVLGVKPEFLPSLLKSLVAVNPDLIVGEGFMRGDWWVEEGSLESVIGVFYQVMQKGSPTALLKSIRKIRFDKAQKNTPEISQSNVAAHYDWEREFFESKLGETMSYSSAIYDLSITKEGLDFAQKRKINMIIGLMGLKPGQKVLDIGSGWGSFSSEIVKHGVSAVGLTLSRKQYEWCREHHKNPNQEYWREDWRPHTENNLNTYDHAVCLEVLDHIGTAQYDQFFSSVASALKPNGSFTMQLILRPTKGETTKWINKYIYPGGYIASYQEVADAFSKAGFKVAPDGKKEFSGEHYAKTLEAWRKGFQAMWPKLVGQYGYTDKDRKMWEFYYAASISVFRDAGFSTMQLKLIKQGC